MNKQVIYFKFKKLNSLNSKTKQTESEINTIESVVKTESTPLKVEINSPSVLKDSQDEVDPDLEEIEAFIKKKEEEDDKLIDYILSTRKKTSPRKKPFKSKYVLNRFLETLSPKENNGTEVAPQNDSSNTKKPSTSGSKRTFPNEEIIVISDEEETHKTPTVQHCTRNAATGKCSCKQKPRIKPKIEINSDAIIEFIDLTLDDDDDDWLLME